MIYNDCYFQLKKGNQKLEFFLKNNNLGESVCITKARHFDSDSDNVKYSGYCVVHQLFYFVFSKKLRATYFKGCFIIDVLHI